MTFQELVNKYVSGQNSTEDMERLTRKINWFTEEVKKSNPDLANKFLMKTDLLLNPHFTKETAQYAVSLMKNRDGSTGAHWSYEDTSGVMAAKGYSFDLADWYYVLNMVYSDYYQKEKSTDNYIADAYMFLDDPDAPHDKAKRYFHAMHE